MIYDQTFNIIEIVSLQPAQITDHNIASPPLNLSPDQCGGDGDADVDVDADDGLGEGML